MVYGLQPGVHHPDPNMQSPVSMGKGSMMGSMSHMPMAARYDANRSSFQTKPQFTNTQKGLSAVQSMQSLPDNHSIQDSRENMNYSRGRESVLQASARNNLQL
jgi:hypothetical protein